MSIEKKAPNASIPREDPLPQESLPAYTDDQDHEQGSTATERPSEKSGHGVPTAAAPFNFPSSDLPDYSAVDIPKPFAIPQTVPSPDAPFLSAYPPALLNYGIAKDSWYSFVDTLSAFLSAKVSKQAVHHASDVASRIGETQKQYAESVKQRVKFMGKSAKRFNPFGVIGGGVFLTLGAVGHAVSSVFVVPLQMVSRPKTPRERATVYLATANKDWFHARGLQALLLNTEELSRLLDVAPQQFLGLAQVHDTGSPAEQMKALCKHVGDLEIREPTEQTQIANPATDQRGETSNAAGKRPSKSLLQLGTGTLWLVITQESKVEAVPADEKKSQAA